VSARRGIGGTDLASVCALYLPQYADEWARWSTAADVWMRLVHDVERPRTAIMQRGLEAEPRLRRAFLDAYGGAFRERPEKWIVRHPRLSFVSVSPDDVWTPTGGGACNSPLQDAGKPPDAHGGGVSPPRVGDVYVEFKSASRFSLCPPPGARPTKWGEPETDQIPEGYALQVQLGMDVLGLDVAHLFVGFGDDAKGETGAPAFYYSETRRYILRRKPNVIAAALAYAERFHAEYVATRLPPPVEPEDNVLTWRVLKKLAPPQLDEIHALVNGGLSHRQIAKRFGLTVANVGRLVRCVFKEQSCTKPSEATEAPSQSSSPSSSP
jgi:hypothetical protein